jgi:hypothetical protein
MGDINTFIGEWWLPSNKENKIAGTLTIKENRKFELLLIGDFSVDNWEDCIIGKATKTSENKRKSIILYQCQKLITANIGFVKSNFNVERLLITSKLIEKPVTHFSSCNILSENFARFRSKSNIKANLRGHFNYEIQTKKIDEIQLLSNNQKSINFHFGLSSKFHKNEVLLKDVSSIKIKYKNEVSIKEIDKDRRIIDAFFTIISDNPTYSNDIILYHVTDDVPLRKIDFKLEEKNKLLNSNFNTSVVDEILFSLEEISKGLLLGFYNFYQSNEQIIGYFIDNKFNKYLQVENRFLNIVSALEIYSRKIKPDSEIKKNHQEIRSRILANCTKNEKEWLEKRVKDYIQLKLKDRLLLLINKFLPKNSISFLNSEVDKIVETRHKLVHLKVLKTENVITDSIQLSILSDKLEILFSLVILNECDFSNEEVEIAFKKLLKNRGININAM